jgi:regulator of sigma E protease
VAYATGVPDPQNLSVRIAEVVAGSPADQAGLREGDVLVVVDGTPIRSPATLSEYLSTHGGQRTTLEVERGGTRETLVATPRVDPPPGQGALGVRLSVRALPTQHDPLTSLQFGVRQTINVMALTLSAPAMVISGALPTEAVRPIGIPGMSQMAAEATSAVVESGWLYPILFLAGVFSTGLAVANMLPLPALDGGRLLFVGIEAIRGRPVPARLEGAIHLAGLMMLLTLMIAISANDILSPVPGIDWGIP